MDTLSLQSLHRHQGAPTIAPSLTNQNMHSLYAIRPNTKPISSLLAQLPSSQRQQQQFDSVHENRNAKIKQSQKIAKNVHVTPIVGVIIPEHSYQLNSNIDNNEVSDKKELEIFRIAYTSNDLCEW